MHRCKCNVLYCHVKYVITYWIWNEAKTQIFRGLRNRCCYVLSLNLIRMSETTLGIPISYLSYILSTHLSELVFIVKDDIWMRMMFELWTYHVVTVYPKYELNLKFRLIVDDTLIVSSRSNSCIPLIQCIKTYGVSLEVLVT